MRVAPKGFVVLNYYQKHLGDYAKKTGHLNALEHGVYNLIMDAYYDRERGPTLVEAMKWAKASTEAEKAAVLGILDEFFQLGDDDRYFQTKIDDAIVGMLEAMADSEAKKENEKERQVRHRARRKDLFEKLRAFDEVPSYETSTEELQRRLDTHLSRVRMTDATANQYPIPNTQYPIPKESRDKATATRLPADWSPSDEEIIFCQTERKDLQVSHVAERFKDYWIAQPGVKGRKADWSATWRNWVRNEKILPSARAGPPQGYESAKDKSRRETIEGLTGRSKRNESNIIDI